jgi:hypothetical protein
MKGLRNGVLVALVLASVAVGIASPAFATPRLTTSTGTAVRPDNGAVSPFFTPIGRSEGSAITITDVYPFGQGWSFKARTASGTTLRETCSRVRASGFVGPTHTYIRISELEFTECKIDGLNIPSVAQVMGVDSETPLRIHLRRSAGASSWDATLNIGPGRAITLTAAGIVACRLFIGPQSITARDTDVRTQLEIPSSPAVFKSEAGSDPNVCPVPQAGVGFIEAATAITYRHETRATEERFFRSTATSNLGDATTER